MFLADPLELTSSLDGDGLPEDAPEDVLLDLLEDTRGSATVVATAAHAVARRGPGVVASGVAPVLAFGVPDREDGGHVDLGDRKW